ncbi:hypothetical protein ACQ33O_02415 [Ferruginibacter sp. SUN002]|uniref:hypothetical protein n=1 Tax=Ferruginibacter sp. SUN002 TaxID=2937789 RepID=UPI003D36C075
MQSLGITIARYGADQMILTRLVPGHISMLKDFFIKRVFPLSLAFCVFFIFNYRNLSSLTFLLGIPMEVYVIITILELNVSKKYYHSLGLNLLGYPLIFALYILLSLHYTLGIDHILLIFLGTSCIRFLVAFLVRRNREKQQGVYILSNYVPVQQVTNYWLFKADYLILSSNLMSTSLFSFTLPNDYFFYTRFTEIYTGITTSLAPVLAQKKLGENGGASIIKNKYYLGIVSLFLVVQLVASLLLLRNIDTLHILMLIPFAITTFLIVPVNMITYNFYRNDHVKLSSKINIFCFFIACIFILINVIFKLPLLFAFIVPVQLVAFMIISNYYKSVKNV